MHDAHIIADLEIELGTARREIAKARLLLIDARSALEEGRLHIVDEFTDRALGHLDLAAPTRK